MGQRCQQPAGGSVVASGVQQVGKLNHYLRVAAKRKQTNFAQADQAGHNFEHWLSNQQGPEQLVNVNWLFDKKVNL